ncbi:MAG: YdcF family protein [Chloroflexi bacterium]|nr:YdcF family protein [Chloroflexota bacterium]
MPFWMRSHTDDHATSPVAAPPRPAAFLRWLRPRRAWQRWLLRMMLVGMALLVVGGIALAVFILRYGAEDRARPAAVIVVLGGGPSATERRTRHAATLYAQGYAEYVICSGGAPDGSGVEANRCARMALKRGVPEDAIIVEPDSRSTEENAIEVARIMAERGWDNAVLVSDDFHLWRAHLIFEAEGLTVYPSPAQLTDHSMNSRDRLWSVSREVLALGWYAGKTVLGLPYTDFSLG